MVNNSIYTNPSAFAALKNLTVINRKLEISQNTISSGLKVASATDNTSSFAIAQGIRAEIAAMDATNKSVVKIKGIVDYNLAATEGISNLIGELKSKLTEMQDTSLSTTQRTQIVADFNNLLSQGKDFARGAVNLDQVGGAYVNLWSVGGAPANIAVDINPGISAQNPVTAAGAIITVSSAVTQTVMRGLTSMQATARTQTAANATSTITTDFLTFEQNVATALGHLGAKSEQLAAHAQFLEGVKGSRQELLGAYVDADLAAESAKLTALQVQQQLAVQAVGIANQRPQSLLGLFR